MGEPLSLAREWLNAPVCRNFALLTLAALQLGGVARAVDEPQSDPSSDVRQLAQAGKSADALRRADALIARFPDDPRLPFEKAVVLTEQKRTADAIVVLQQLRRTFPELPEPLNNLAVLYARQGEFDRARQALEESLHVLPSARVAYANLGALNLRLSSRAYARALHIDDGEAAPTLALIRTLQPPATATMPSAVAIAPVASQAAVATAMAMASPQLPQLPTPKPQADAANTPAVSASTVAPSARPRPPLVAAAASTVVAADKPAASMATAAKPSIGLDTTDAREVNIAIHAWAASWSQKNLAVYFAAYLPGYKGSEGSAANWQAARKARILGKAHISVDISRLTVDLPQSGTARATFHQEYAADQLKVSSQKTLELLRQDGKWLIRKESAG